MYIKRVKNESDGVEYTIMYLFFLNIYTNLHSSHDKLKVPAIFIPTK